MKYFVVMNPDADYYQYPFAQKECGRFVDLNIDGSGGYEFAEDDLVEISKEDAEAYVDAIHRAGEGEISYEVAQSYIDKFKRMGEWR